MNKLHKYSHGHAFLFNGFFLTLTTGVFLNDYLLRLGFQPYDFGIFYAVINLNGLIAFPFSFFSGSTKRKKPVYLVTLCISLCFSMLFILASYLFEEGSRMIVLGSTASIALFYIEWRIGQLIIIPWMYDVVGEEKWAKFFSFRMNFLLSLPGGTSSQACSLFTGTS